MAYIALRLKNSGDKVFVNTAYILSVMPDQSDQEKTTAVTLAGDDGYYRVRETVDVVMEKIRQCGEI